ncbi:MAG: carboxymuconolactone decarboxylase family protein [Chloroflexi bacterium]|nr:carboxymuconolactone decarboxylase family protein [Chloroflexota bacterium]
MARVRLLTNDEAPPKTRELFEKIENNGATVLNLYRAVGHSPSTISSFIKLGNVLLNHAELPSQIRELAILRIANLAGSEYEWNQHVPIATEVGINSQQIDEIHQWKSSGSFSDEERAVLQYTDEVTIGVAVEDDTFAALQQYLSERSIVELTISIAYWGMIARVLVPLNIELEERSVGSVTDLLGKHKGGA